MIINVPIWAGFLYTLMLVGGGFGAAFTAFRNGNRKAQNEASEAQKNAIDAMRQQIDIQKDTIETNGIKIAALEAKVAALETFNHQLADLLTGRQDWAKISQQVDKIAKHLGVEE